MPRSEDLHGNAPDKAVAALLLIDFSHEDPKLVEVSASTFPRSMSR